MKKVLMLLSLVLFIPLSVSAASFPDVNDQTPYQEAIYWMADQGVVEGYFDGTFAPDKCVNRVEFLKILVWMKQIDTTDFEKITFNDTQINAWYTPYLSAAFGLGVVEGYPDGSFKPDQCVNRVEAIKMASEQFFVSADWGVSGYEYFEDVDYNQWYGEYMQLAHKHNLLGQDHVSGNNYDPAGFMSRKEVVELLYRYKASVDNGKIRYTEALTPKEIEHTLRSDSPTTIVDDVQEDVVIDGDWYVNEALNFRVMINDYWLQRGYRVLERDATNYGGETIGKEVVFMADMEDWKNYEFFGVRIVPVAAVEAFSECSAAESFEGFVLKTDAPAICQKAVDLFYTNEITRADGEVYLQIYPVFQDIPMECDNGGCPFPQHVDFELL